MTSDLVKVGFSTSLDLIQDSSVTSDLVNVGFSACLDLIKDSYATSDLIKISDLESCED